MIIWTAQTINNFEVVNRIFQILKLIYYSSTCITLRLCLFVFAYVYVSDLYEVWSAAVEAPGANRDKC